MTGESNTSTVYANGSYVRVRDEDWIVTHAEETTHDGWLLQCQGVSELVHGMSATFLEALDEIQPLLPEQTGLWFDDTSNYLQSRLFIEAQLRSADIPRSTTDLVLSDNFLLDPLDYQLRPAQMVLKSLRPRLLIADVVGLGKTLEIGLALAELIRRGRGDRILVVVPQQVLDQFQMELWARFSIPLLRMDSQGIERVMRQLPAGRNPFHFHKRIIISIDTLKSKRWLRYLEKVSWDAVVFDESHNLVGSSGRNLRQRLAALVSRTTEALIFASATPHPGKDKDFAKLIRMLDPVRIADVNDYSAEDIEGLYIRRTKTDPEVRQALRSSSEIKWADRGDARSIQVTMSPEEQDVFDTILGSWLERQRPGSSVKTFFPYTLLKAFFSSPDALAETIANRKGKGDEGEARDLATLGELVAKVSRPGKFAKLVEYLAEIGVGPGKHKRVVIFSERHATLKWLRDNLIEALGFDQEAVAVVHSTKSGEDGPDVRRAIEQFGLGSSPLRVLLAGDIASEGVNLHKECSDLVHWDLPWSLIRIEQRNGRIDRYGQAVPPQFAALMLRSADEDTEWDEARVSSSLLAKEAEVNRTLGATQAFVGHANADYEESRLVKAILDHTPVEQAVEAEHDAPGPAVDALAMLLGGNSEPSDGREPVPLAEQPALFPGTTQFVDAALKFVRTKVADEGERDRFRVESDGPRTWHLQHPPGDLLARLTRILPPAYVKDRGLIETIPITTSHEEAKAAIGKAQKRDKKSAWPALSFLSDLHPVTRWLVDKVILAQPRDTVPVVFADTDRPIYCLQGVCANGLGQSAVVEWMAVSGGPQNWTVEDMTAELDRAGVNESLSNPGVPSTDAQKAIRDAITAHFPAVLDKAREHLDQARAAWDETVDAAIGDRRSTVDQWEQTVIDGLETMTVRRKTREERAREEAELERAALEKLRPRGESLVKFVAVVVPRDFAG
ncbi:DEAD/DEAH box helicase [Glycomyces tenuis]|uniref:DEAD/DEAH box helicase n=1 Tax=Glycomyces tenuis TaxID=58116 RepID=UPI000429084E|nr:DEAD/DEAH box helicase [Glycomyces tenuis]